MSGEADAPAAALASPAPGKGGRQSIVRRWRRWREECPTRLLNFIVQRIVGVNRDCRWSVHFTSRVTTSHRLVVHPSVYPSFALSGGCYIQGINGVEIGEGTIFAPGVKLISANHDPLNPATWDSAPPIRIGKHCWIAANAVILPGVTLGDRVVVGAGSVVTRSFDGGCVVAGVPARMLRRLEPSESKRSCG